MSSKPPIVNPFGDNPLEKVAEPNPYSAPMEPVKPHMVPLQTLEGFETTRTGLKLVYYGVILILIVGIISKFTSVFGTILNGDGRGVRQQSPIVGLMSIVSYGAIIIASLMSFIGQCCCLSVPAQTGAKGSISMATVAQVISIVISIGFVIYIVVAGSQGQIQGTGNASLGLMMAAFYLGTLILGVIAFVSFMNFIKKVGEYIQRHEIAALSRRIMGIFGFLVVAYMLMLGVTVMLAMGAGGGGPSAAAGMGLVLMVGGLVVLVVGIVMLCMYTTLLRNTINALSQPHN